MKKIKFITGVILLTILSSLLFTGCGISQSQLDAVVAEKDALQSQLDAVAAEKDALQSQLDAVAAEKDALQSELDEIKAVYPLRGFETVSEFKDWIVDHVQPETVYIDDAFLAAYKVQQAGISDGYLFGIDIDHDEDGYPNAAYVTVFIGNDLYWWFVEDVEAYDNFGLTR